MRCAALREGYHQEPTRAGVADDEFAPFGLGVIDIRKDVSERVREYRDSLLERDVMRAAIGDGLFRVPFEYESHCGSARLPCRLSAAPDVVGRSNDMEFSGERSESAATTG